MSPQDGEGGWEAEEKRLREEWNATVRPGRESLYAQRERTGRNSPYPSPEGDIRPTPSLGRDPGLEKRAQDKADADLERFIKSKEDEYNQRKAAEQKEVDAKKDEEIKRDVEDKNKQVQSQLESVRRPEALRQQSYRVLNEEGTAVASGKEPIEPMARETAQQKEKTEPDSMPAIKADHQQMEKQSIDADRMEVALQERDRQAHQKELLETEVLSGKQAADQHAVEERQPSQKTEIQFTSMESLAIKQERYEEIIRDRESQEREKALEEIKRRLEQEAELRKELNRKKGLGLGD